MSDSTPSPQPLPFELVDVTKRYADETAVDRLSLAIADRETLALIGPSGCGKSTTLRLLVGLLLPDEGEVRFRGEPLSERMLPTLRKRIGYVIQEGGLFPHLTGRGNLSLMPQQLGWTTERLRSRIAELSQLVRLDESLLDRFPQQLSGGQRQRIGLMRALMLDPEVLLLDEPLGALDPLVRADLQNDLKAIFNELGKTVVIVTHDLAEAAWFANRIVLMRDGKIVQSGTVDTFRDAPANEFVTEFLTAQRTMSW